MSLMAKVFSIRYNQNNGSSLTRGVITTKVVFDIFKIFLF